MSTTFSKKEMEEFDPQRLQIERILDIGYIARVFKVKDKNSKDKEDEEDKAIKIYPLTWSSQYFENEVNVYRNLQSVRIHVNIMRFYGAFSGEEEKILLLEYCEGGNLRQILHKARDPKEPIPIEPANRKRWLSELMEGLKFLHDNGITHRDIHPRNILLKNGTIKIGDFRVVQKEAVEGNTRFGSLRYRSPEVCNMLNSPANHLDPNITYHKTAADIWSFGCILYEMYTLNRVIQQKGDLNILRELLNPHFAIPVLNSGDLNLDALYAQMLSIDPQQRPTADIALTIL